MRGIGLFCPSYFSFTLRPLARPPFAASFLSEEAGSKTCPGCDHAALKIPALVSSWPKSIAILIDIQMLIELRLIVASSR